ncbi:MAG TPA: hypothetical protein H9887_03740 [Candidatus Dorea intestinavium]|nr:hypothetical protein [Candidatus Dorea intestinavium]
MKKRVTPLTNLGTVSLLMILIVLFLVTFSTLSLTGSLRDHYLSENVADNTYHYYQANNRANLMLYDIDQAFLSLSDYEGEDFDQLLLKKLSAIENLKVEQRKDSNQLLLSFSEEAGKKQILNIELLTSSQKDFNQGFYTIKKWVTTPTKDWSGDHSYHLM